MTYLKPLPGHVVRRFVAPLSAYGAGHRGVDLASSAGEVVRADAPGLVTFAGQIAGRGVVVLAHPDGVRTEFEPLHPTVKQGSVIAAGGMLGTVEGTHPGCPPDGCLHWGARRGSEYFDPLTLLAPLGPVRLLPWMSR